MSRSVVGVFRGWFFAFIMDISTLNPPLSPVLLAGIALSLVLPVLLKTFEKPSRRFSGVQPSRPFSLKWAGFDEIDLYRQVRGQRYMPDQPLHIQRHARYGASVGPAPKSPGGSKSHA